MTIAIPTFNRADGLRRSLASALEQDHPSVEVLVCDNASTDGTYDVVQEHLSPGRTLRYLRHDSNRGALQNFRSGLDEATGEYFMWLADDDWIDPDYVSRCTDLLSSDPRAVLANGNARYYKNGAFQAGEAGVELTQASPSRRIIGYYSWVRRNGAFYGVSKTDARRSVPLQDALGSDWIHVAQLAAMGTIRSASTTIHRSDDGASTRIKMSVWGVTRPIARLVAADISSAPTFHMSRGRRTSLALACSGVVYWRYGMLYWRDRVVNRVARGLKAKLPEHSYERLHRAYQKLTGRPESE